MDKKTDVAGIYKAEEGILINKDSDGLKAYKNRKNKEKKLDDLIKMHSDIVNLKSDMEEIKQLLKGLSR